MPTAAEQAQLRFIATDMVKVTERGVRQVTANVHKCLVSPVPIGTPVDTGYARASWVPRVGFPLETSVGIPGAEGVASARAAQQAGLNQVAGYRLVQGRVYITNNTEYINLLDLGRSQQTPAGFVERCIAMGIDRARSGSGIP